MSKLLDALIEQRRQEALGYQEYLKRIIELSRQAGRPESQASYPAAIDTGALRALYDNLHAPSPSRTEDGRFPSTPVLASTTRESLALALDYAIRAVKKADWRGNQFKEREVRNAIRAKLGEDDGVVDRIFEIVKAQREY
jgi:type I restriction enzyme R subunit